MAEKKACRTIENTFSICNVRWRIFQEPIKYDIETVQLIAKACVCLYKLLQLFSCTFCGPSGFVDTEH